MTVNLSINELIEYTDWERQKWYDRLRKAGDDALTLGAGPNGDGRFERVGDLMRHIFSAEKRYVERLSNLPLTNTSVIPSDSLETLFEFSRESRKRLKEFVATFPENKWDTTQEFMILNYKTTATPRKIVAHVLMHEIRHWAQIGTLLRLNGIVDEFHDFLASPVMGGGFVKQA
ncbi:MAG: DinB family protein [Candidatus Acidiferrales bacterium]